MEEGQPLLADAINTKARGGRGGRRSHRVTRSLTTSKVTCHQGSRSLDTSKVTCHQGSRSLAASKVTCHQGSSSLAVHGVDNKKGTLSRNKTDKHTKFVQQCDSFRKQDCISTSQSNNDFSPLNSISNRAANDCHLDERKSPQPKPNLDFQIRNHRHEVFSHDDILGDEIVHLDADNEDSDSSSTISIIGCRPTTRSEMKKPTTDPSNKKPDSSSSSSSPIPTSASNLPSWCPSYRPIMNYHSLLPANLRDLPLSHPCHPQQRLPIEQPGISSVIKRLPKALSVTLAKRTFSLHLVTGE